MKIVTYQVVYNRRASYLGCNPVAVGADSRCLNIGSFWGAFIVSSSVYGTLCRRFEMV